jgi:hypothetical protein
MMLYLVRNFILMVLVFNLTACALFQNNPQANQKAVCKELNYRMINNGATGNRLLATQQAAQSESLARSYHAEGCS